MTYVSKKEKVFDLPEQEDSSISLNKTETKLKRFPSVSDRRAWTSEECQRYQHLYGLVNGSESNISKSSSFKYIPFDVLLAILMAEKDAYIQELLERQEDNRSSCGGKANVLYKADGFEDSDDDREALIRKDAEMVSLKNKIAGLESELEDCRDTLTKAMHKLEKMDAIISENNLLREKIQYSEETIKCLERRKGELEKELEYYRNTYNTPVELDAKKKHLETRRHWDGGDCEKVVRLSSERDILIKQVEELQKELERTKTDAAEIEILKKISETTSSSLEELSKENDCYKKKIESVKFLEKHVEDLKRQAQTLTEKYKKESQKANDQLKQLNTNAKEIQMLKEEKNKLQARIDELESYESQYLSLKGKLHQVELIIDENEILNKKLLQLDRLEVENQQLKMRLEVLKNEEVQAVEDKKKVLQLQKAVAEQEEEIRNMLKHIEELTNGYEDKSEIYRLRLELDEKNGKLKKYEKQLNDIPVLESEIDELKNKLQKCIDDFKSDKDLLRRLQEELEACRKRCHELEEMAPFVRSEITSNAKIESSEISPSAVGESEQHPTKEKVEYTEKGENTTEIPTSDAESQSEKPQLEDKTTLIVDETVAKIQKFEEQNQLLKKEVASLTSKLSKIDLDKLIAQTNDLKSLLLAKDGKIGELNVEIKQIRNELRSYELLKQELENEVELLKENSSEMKKELSVKELEIKNINEVLKVERKGKEFALSLIETLEGKLEMEKVKRETGEVLMKLQKEEANVAKQEIYLYFAYEISCLSNVNKMWKKLNQELKTENRILGEMKEYLEKYEIRALKNLVTRLRAEVKALKSLSKPELENEFEALQHQVRKLLEETDSLIDEIKTLKSALDSEKNAKDCLEKVVVNLKEELSACVSAGNALLGRELTAKDNLIFGLQEELTKVKNDLENSAKESRALSEKNEMLMENINSLDLDQKELKNEINSLQLRQHEFNKTIKDLEEREEILKKTVKEFEEKEEELNRIIKEQKEKEEELNKTLAEEKEKKEELNEILKEEKEKKEELNKILKEEKEKKEELNESIRELQKKEKDYLEKIKSFEEMRDLWKSEKEELSLGNEFTGVLRERIKDLEESLKMKELGLNAKEEEFELVKLELLNAKNELKKVKSEMEVLKHRLDEKNPEDSSDSQDYPNYERDLEEKYALEETLRSLENELDELKVKLEECEKMEEEMANLRNKRDTLQEKMLDFEKEIDSLKEKLSNFESVKSELNQLKAKKNISSEDLDVSKLYQELLELKTEAANLKKENGILKEELLNAQSLLEIQKNLQNSIPETLLPPTSEFFTPPALPSPHSSGPYEPASEMISLEVHKKEITDLENLHEHKMQHLKDLNSEKLKKLTEYYEKEAKCRTKSFYESVNAVKNSYENDIKKLVEKHKASIMRLQGLHEDEVQELNTTYETQMEAMQTQNENLINDLRTEAAEKYKQLREQHNRDIRELARKYEDLLREKEAQFLAEKSNVETSLTESTNDMKEVHQQAMDDLTQFYQNSILEMEEKHCQELKKCKKSNLKRIELMKNKYEALLVEERKKYEEQLEEMLLQLKTGQQGDILRSEREHFVQRKPPTLTNPSLDFPEVLQKILNEGLECLTFEELILVHGKTCFLPQSVQDDAGEGEYSPRFTGCRHRELMAAEKEELLKRIFTLEHEMVIKQLETHEAIVNMEAAEICRIQELKNALCTAQQKNAELKRLLSNQSKQEMGLKIDRYMSDKQATFHETNVMEKVKELEKERAEKKHLEDELQKEKLNVRNLMSAIDAEKERHQIQRKRDAEYVESIRQRLEEALNHEQMMETKLDYEIKVRSRLEAELKNLQKSLHYVSDVPSPPLQIEIKAAKNIKNQDQSEMTKETKHGRSKSRHRSKLKSINN